MPTRPSRSHARAFTLTELIVAIVVVGVLAALAVPAFRAVVDRSADEVRSAEVAAAVREAQALAAFRGDGVWSTDDFVQAAEDTAEAADMLVAASRSWTVIFDDDPTDGQAGAMADELDSLDKLAVEISADGTVAGVTALGAGGAGLVHAVGKVTGTPATEHSQSADGANGAAALDLLDGGPTVVAYVVAYSSLQVDDEVFVDRMESRGMTVETVPSSELGSHDFSTTDLVVGSTHRGDFSLLPAGLPVLAHHKYVADQLGMGYASWFDGEDAAIVADHPAAGGFTAGTEIQTNTQPVTGYELSTADGQETVLAATDSYGRALAATHPAGGYWALHTDAGTLTPDALTVWDQLVDHVVAVE